MSLQEAEALAKQWQDIKSEALGPNYLNRYALQDPFIKHVMAYRGHA